MQYKAVDELEKFSFRDAEITDMKMEADKIRFELEAVIVRSTNSANEMMCDSYAGTLDLRLMDAAVTDFYLGGYKYYDANDVLQEEVPDKKMPIEDLSGIIKAAEKVYICELTAKNAGQKEKTFCYELGLDVDEETYWATIAFDKSIAEWDRYMNKVQMTD